MLQLRFYRINSAANGKLARHMPLRRLFGQRRTGNFSLTICRARSVRDGTRNTMHFYYCSCSAFLHVKIPLGRNANEKRNHSRRTVMLNADKSTEFIHKIMCGASSVMESIFPPPKWRTCISLFYFFLLLNSGRFSYEIVKTQRIRRSYNILQLTCISFFM